MNKIGRKQRPSDDRPEQPLRWYGRSCLNSALCLVGFVFFFADLNASAQSEGGAAQIVAPAILSIQSATESHLQIRVISPDKNAFVLIEGLPKTVALSTGRLFESGVWAVKVSELQELKIVAMVNTNEQRDLVLSLKTLDGTVLAEMKSSLRISPVSQAGNDEAETPPSGSGDTEVQAVAISPTSTQVETKAEASLNEEAPNKADRQAAVAPVISEDDMESIRLLMRKGNENMQQGKINIARLFYTRAADKGWADAAFSLARTYDEVELRQIGAIGVDSDPELAAQWYKRAVELGSKTAVAYLERLR